VVGYTTSTVAFRVVQGDEKGSRRLGLNWFILAVANRYRNLLHQVRVGCKANSLAAM
jgi:hypothetical protein